MTTLRPPPPRLIAALILALAATALPAQAQLNVARRKTFDAPPAPSTADAAPTSIYGAAAAAVLRSAASPSGGPTRSSLGTRASPTGSGEAQSLPLNGFAGSGLSRLERPGDADAGGFLAAAGSPRNGLARSTDPAPTCRLTCARTFYVCSAQEDGDGCARAQGVCVAACAAPTRSNLGGFAAPQ